MALQVNTHEHEHYFVCHFVDLDKVGIADAVLLHGILDDKLINAEDIKHALQGSLWDITVLGTHLSPPIGDSKFNFTQVFGVLLHLIPELVIGDQFLTSLKLQIDQTTWSDIPSLTTCIVQMLNTIRFVHV